jgi:hypothetical protein
VLVDDELLGEELLGDELLDDELLGEAEGVELVELLELLVLETCKSLVTSLTPSVDRASSSAWALSASVGTVPCRWTTPLLVSTWTETSSLGCSLVSLALILVVMAASSSFSPTVSAADATSVGPATSVRVIRALSNAFMFGPSGGSSKLQALGRRESNGTTGAATAPS